MRTEAGRLVGCIATALAWANLSSSSYDDLWSLRVSVHIGDVGADRALWTWVNNGLMTLFFLVIGLETPRELDLSDLRERQRFLLPIVTGLVGPAVPVAINAINAGGPGAHGWGVAMSIDSALALDLLAVSGSGVPDRMRTLILTIFGSTTSLPW